jgi:hypothetical protein
VSSGAFDAANAVGCLGGIPAKFLTEPNWDGILKMGAADF